jgi:endonuclease/exonuclease/phosphatase family metal-dependent hydrolase
VTYNMLHGGPFSAITGDDQELERRLGMAIDALQALAPDVVALQEASEGRGRGNVAARIAAALGLHHVHAPATDRVFPLRWLGKLLVWLLGFNEGSAILSRYPIVASEVHELPRCRKQLDPRVMLRARLATPWGELDVYSAHISRDDCQIERVAEIAIRERGRLPSLLMGDLNAGDTSPAIGRLTNGAGLVDVFRTANPTAPGPTVWQRVTAAAPTVFRRVDYVFLVPGRECAGRVVGSRVVLDAPGRSANGHALWPSDHYGVLGEIDLASGACAARGPELRS